MITAQVALTTALALALALALVLAAGVPLLARALTRRRSHRRAHPDGIVEGDSGEIVVAAPPAFDIDRNATRDMHPSHARSGPAQPPAQLPARPGPAMPAPTRVRPAQVHPAPPSAVRTQLLLTDAHAEYGAHVVDLPAGRRHVTVGVAGADIELPDVSTGMVALELNGERWLVSCSRPDVAYLDGLPLRDVGFPLFDRSEVGVGRWRLRLAYGDSVISPEVAGALAVSHTPGSPSATTAVVEGLLAAAFDPWEPRPGPAAVARALSALRAIGLPEPRHCAIVGHRIDGTVEVAGSGGVEVMMDDGAGWRPLPEGGPLLKRLAVAPGEGRVLAVHVGEADRPALGIDRPDATRRERLERGATLLLPG